MQGHHHLRRAVRSLSSSLSPRFSLSSNSIFKPFSSSSSPTPTSFIKNKNTHVSKFVVSEVINHTHNPNSCKKDEIDDYLVDPEVGFQEENTEVEDLKSFDGSACNSTVTDAYAAIELALDSVVKIFTVASSPNFILPWQNKSQRETNGSGKSSFLLLLLNCFHFGLLICFML